MTDGTSVPIAKAKGRPMLQWVGKRPLREVRSFPAQLVERFASAAPAEAHTRCGEWLLFAGVHDLMHLEQLHRIANELTAGEASRAAR